MSWAELRPIMTCGAAACLADPMEIQIPVLGLLVVSQDDPRIPNKPLL
jgi:hypothetical protein